MQDLCQICKNFKECPQGEGDKLNPSYGFMELWEKGKDTEYGFVVECDLFEKYPKEAKQ